MSKRHSVIKSFPFAAEGIKTAFRNEPNFRIHIGVATIVFIAAIILQVSPTNLAVLVLTIGIVITLELINTMVEALVDLVNPETHPLAKIAKDVSAAAVLISATTAVVVGVLILGQAIIATL